MEQDEDGKVLTFTARNDYAFKKLFGTEENKDICIEFISVVTGLDKADFEEVSFENRALHTAYHGEKAGRVDIIVRMKSGEKINTEMQNVWLSSYTKRSLYYWAKLFTADFAKGSIYSDLKRTVVINVPNETFPLTDKVHSVYKILGLFDNVSLSNRPASYKSLK